MELVPVDGAVLEAEVRGSGEPVVLVQTALLADELQPLARQPALRDLYRTVVYHRRGYAGSSPVDGPRSVTLDAADCRALLSSLGIERAHVVGCRTAARSRCNSRSTHRSAFPASPCWSRPRCTSRVHRSSGS